METLISVIIPVYNVEKYLKRCLDSVISQTYENLEIILIDDGSTDTSGKICDEYAIKDKRIRVIHKENGGLSSARNAGLDVAVGNYVTMIDSDDFVLKNHIETMYNQIVKYNADVAAVGFNIFFDGDNETLQYNNPDVILHDRESVIKELLHIGSIKQSAWGKLYRLELFNDIRYPVGKLYEDLAVIYKIMLKTDKTVYIDAALYQYYMRENSIMQSDFFIKQYVEVEFIEESMQLVENAYLELKDEACGRKVWSYCKTLHRILSSKDKDKYIKEQKEMIYKIKHYGKNLLNKKNIDKNLKIKILTIFLGKNVFQLVQNLSDKIKHIKAGHKYIV